MKVGERFKIEDGRLVHLEAFDPNDGLRQAEYMRHAKEAKGGQLLSFISEEFGDPQYSYPPWLEQVWSNKWKVRMDDPAFEDVIQIELSSGAYEKFKL